MSTKLRLLKIVFIPVLFFSAQLNVKAQWQKTAGPPGMNVNAFYQRANVLFAGTSPAGVFKSADHGLTWSASNSGIEDKNVFSLIADNVYLYAGTDSGVFRSKDNGRSWHAANTGIEQKFVYSLKFANGFLFAGTGSGLYKSSNRGTTWTDANGSALNSSIIYDITYVAPNLVVIADNLIFYSNDNGDTWNYNSNSPFVLGGNPSFFTRNDSVILTSGPVIFRSFDGGINWGNSINVSKDETIDGIIQTNNALLAGTPKGIFSSANFGKTWKAITAAGLRVGKWFTHDFYKSGNKFLLAYDEIGVCYSTDTGKNWNYTLQGFPPTANIDNAMLFSGGTIFSGTHGDGLYKSSNTGTTWAKFGTTNNLDTLSNSNIFSVLKKGNVILAGTCTNGLYRSADNGATWKRIRNGLPQQSSGYLCVHSLAKTTSVIFAATDQGLYYSNDVGVTWLPTNLTGKAVVAVTTNDSIACAAVNNFEGFSAIYRSVNNPASWNIVLQQIVDWASMASDGHSHFYAGTLSTGNYVSKNAGLTWQNVGSGIPDGFGGFTIAVSGKNVFIGNNNGVYFSNNNGTSFTEANTGLGKYHAVQGFAISSTDVYAGVFENSIWKRPLSDFGITLAQSQQNINNILPVTLIPNPLINESKLSYKLASPTHVLIILYDVNGNHIKTITDAVQSEGSYTTTINRAGLHTGNYFVSVIAGDRHAAVNLSIAAH